MADIVFGQLLKAIVDGHIAEGERLSTELELAASFDVSRQTIREALQMLQAEGVVSTRQGSGTYVRRRPPTQLVELSEPSAVAAILRGLEARIPVEAQMAQLAARRRTQGDLDGMAAILRDMQAQRSVMLEPDFAFHRAVAEASHNEYLLKIMALLEDVVRGGMTLAHQISHVSLQERSRRVHEEHVMIYDAIASSDPEGASFAMRFHLEQSRRRLLDRHAVS